MISSLLALPQRLVDRETRSLACGECGRPRPRSLRRRSVYASETFEAKLSLLGSVDANHSPGKSIQAITVVFEVNHETAPAVRRSLTFCTDKIGHRLLAWDKCRMNCSGRKEIAITGAQSINLMTYAQFQFAADDPVRLIFRVSVRAILRSRRVGPLKDTVAFVLQPLAQIGGIWTLILRPFFDLNTHAPSFSRQMMSSPACVRLFVLFDSAPAANQTRV